MALRTNAACWPAARAAACRGPGGSRADCFDAGRFRPSPPSVGPSQAPSLASHARDMSSALSLANIRSTLIRLEDTIIFAFIERAQFRLNTAVYTPDAIPVPGARPHSLSQLNCSLNDMASVNLGVERHQRSQLCLAGLQPTTDKVQSRCCTSLPLALPQALTAAAGDTPC